MSRSLSAAGYACQLCRNRDRLIDMVDSQLPDILLLRLDEKEEGIFSLISQVKEKGVKRILLMVKAGQEALVNGGLFAGGDDYLCLPVRQYELQTRISVLARQEIPP
ncbi:MAG: response regulator transcription factor [Oxalobacter sp.]|nr:response regulator transcription factor [Oxalobacter sp.]